MPSCGPTPQRRIWAGNLTTHTTTVMTRLEKFTNIVLVAAALFVATLVAVDRFGPNAGAPEAVAAVRYVEEWDELSADVAVPIDPPSRTQMLDGITISTDGRNFTRPLPVTLTVFTDFQCPQCKYADSVLVDMLAKEFPTVRRAIVHLPVEATHPQALLAAKAFECADSVGQGPEMYAALLNNQRNLGVKTWTEIAAEAQVEDTTALRRCISEVSEQRIRAGIALAEKLDVSGTPAAVINGWLVDPAVPAKVRATLESAFREARTQSRKE